MDYEWKRFVAEKTEAIELQKTPKATTKDFTVIMKHYAI